MTNVPTDLLRTLIAVVDLRSFTRAAQLHGVTQPAVSAQIKRLQTLLGGELFDKSAPGVMLTAKGEAVVNHARRLLAINDQMLAVTSQREVNTQLRIGLTVDYFEDRTLPVISEFKARYPGLQIKVSAGRSVNLMQGFRQDGYDLVVAAYDNPPTDAFRSWVEKTAWGAADLAILHKDRPVPVVLLGEDSLSHRMTVAAFEDVHQEFRIEYVSGSFAGLMQAAICGFGVTAWAERALRQAGLQIFGTDAPLPPIPDVYGAVHLRAGLERSDLAMLATMIADKIQTPAAS